MANHPNRATKQTMALSRQEWMVIRNALQRCYEAPETLIKRVSRTHVPVVDGCRGCDTVHN